MLKSSANEKTLSHLTALGEGFTIEFKRSGTSGLGREICAFANATGAGTLIACLDEKITREDIEPLALGITE